MFLLIYFLLFTLTHSHKCSFQNSTNKFQYIYLCRESFNSSTLRIALYFKFNKTIEQENIFSYYAFTLRFIDLLDEHKIHLEDRFEKRISDYVKINFTKQENYTINIQNLPAGRYEICVNFLNNQIEHFYHRSPTSCLYVPWNAPEFEADHSNGLMRVILVISIIVLFVTLAFFIYTIHQFFLSRKPPIRSVDPEEEKDEDMKRSERARLLVYQHFEKDVNPFELLVRRRIHERYAHSSP